jgi:hypothetical protein
MGWILWFMPDREDGGLEKAHPLRQERRRKTPIVRLAFMHMLEEPFLVVAQGFDDRLLDRPH